MFLSITEILSSIEGILGLLITLITGAAYPAIKVYKKKKSEKLTFNNKIDKIFYELVPNGGHSVKDLISKIDYSLKKISSKLSIVFNFQRDIGIWESDKDGNCIFINEILSGLLGISSEQARDNGWVLGVHPDDRNHVFNEWTLAVKQHRAFSLKYRMHNIRTNKTTPVSVNSEVITVNNKVIGWIGIVIPDEALVPCKAHGFNPIKIEPKSS